VGARAADGSGGAPTGHRSGKGAALLHSKNKVAKASVLREVDLRKRPRPPEAALQPVAGNGLIDRRALLGRGVLFAGAVGTGSIASSVGAAAEPGRSKGDLRDGFLAGDQQGAPTAARDRAERAEEERRLADPRLPSDEDERSGYETASQHSIELGDPGRDALGLVSGDLPEGNRRESPCRCGRVRAVEFLDQGPERSATGTTTEPAAARRTALRARELNRDLGHRTAQSRSTVRRRCHDCAPTGLQLVRR